MSAVAVCRSAVFSLILMAILPLHPSIALAEAKAPAGDLWETTSQISMEGMPMEMPKQTVRSCTPHEWTKPPSHSDQSGECVTSDFKHDGKGKTTWTTVCKGHHAMTGKGEIIRDGKDDYTGTIKFSSAQGNMLIKMTGHRIGSCDNPE